MSRELDRDRLQPRIRAVMDRLDVAIPRGVRTKGVWRLPNRGVLEQAGLARKVARLIPLGVVKG
ncbi:MAG TPA: hypothetical protein VEF72_01125 [Mycobacterium sp.]|nr:hypothetical protein [Mycobacterium sp.]